MTDLAATMPKVSSTTVKVSVRGGGGGGRRREEEEERGGGGGGGRGEGGGWGDARNCHSAVFTERRSELERESRGREIPLSLENSLHYNRHIAAQCM